MWGVGWRVGIGLGSSILFGRGAMWEMSRERLGERGDRGGFLSENFVYWQDLG